MQRTSSTARPTRPWDRLWDHWRIRRNIMVPWPSLLTIIRMPQPASTFMRIFATSLSRLVFLPSRLLLSSREWPSRRSSTSSTRWTVARYVLSWVVHLPLVPVWTFRKDYIPSSMWMHLTARWTIRSAMDVLSDRVTCWRNGASLYVCFAWVWKIALMLLLTSVWRPREPLLTASCTARIWLPTAWVTVCLKRRVTSSVIP